MIGVDRRDLSARWPVTTPIAARSATA